MGEESKNTGGGLTLLVGVPAAGKTTLAQGIGQQLSKAHAITFDAWPGEWSGRLRHKHDAIFQHVAAQVSLDRETVLILDDTMHLQSMRKRYWRLCQTRCIGICFIKIECPLAVAVERELVRNPAERVGRDTVKKIHATMEAFTAEQESFVIRTNDQEIDVGLIRTILEHSRTHFCAQQQACERNRLHRDPPASLVHRANLILNELVHRAIAGLSRTDGSVFCERKELLLRIKRELFAQFKEDPSDSALGGLPLAFMRNADGQLVGHNQIGAP